MTKNEETEEEEYVPILTLRQKREFIGLFSRAIFPHTIAGVLTWYANGAPNQVPAIFDEVSEMARQRGLIIVRNAEDDHLMVVKKTKTTAITKGSDK